MCVYLHYRLQPDDCIHITVYVLFAVCLEMNEAPIVTLTTDWGDRDFFAAMVKGRLCSYIHNVRVFDVSHHLRWDDLMTSMNAIRFGCLSFPQGSVHIVDVGCYMSHSGPPEPLAIRSGGHYFVCNDKRLMELSLDMGYDEAVNLRVPESIAFRTFLAHDLFCDVVRRILNGESLTSMGEPCTDFRVQKRPSAQPDGDSLVAVVTNVDSYGNAYLNITYSEFEEIRAGRRFRLDIGNSFRYDDRTEPVQHVRSHYNEVRMGNIVLTVSATGYMQIALNKTSASKLLSLNPTSQCIFTFME